MATFNPSDFYTLLSSFSDNVKAPCLTGEFNIYKSNVCVKALPSYQGRLSLPIYKDIVFNFKLEISPAYRRILSVTIHWLFSLLSCEDKTTWCNYYNYY